MTALLRSGMLFMLVTLCLPWMSSAQPGSSVNEPPNHQNIVEGFVFFTDDQRLFLKSEPYRFQARMDNHQLGREIIGRIIQGPSQDGRQPTWPETAKLNAFFISDDKDAYVDLDLPADLAKTMDARAELLAVYSLVNSLTVNIPDIKRVKILLSGREAKTLAGHLDIEFYYQTNMLIVK